MIDIQIEEEHIVPQIMLDDIRMALSNVDSLQESLVDQPYIAEYQWEDFLYDINLIQAAKTMYRHYTVHSDWDNLDNYKIELDHDLTETSV